MKLTSPLQSYQELLQAQHLQANDDQAVLIKHLQHLFEQLTQRDKKFWNMKPFKKNNHIKGLYIWGNVGVGKTFMMDVFANCLPHERVLRIHFHKFMKMIHEQLTALSGITNPLQQIAANIAKTVDVLCFDEFIVDDIVDAMILAGLLKALFEKNLCLVTTSNTAPENLYKEGLQRDAFLPAIELIKLNTDIIEMKRSLDYRVVNSQHATSINSLLNSPAHQSLLCVFKSLAKSNIHWESGIFINHEHIATHAHSDEVVWFDFNVICHTPRSKLDYLEIARLYENVLVSNVPKIEKHQHDAAQYLINLVDVLHDAKVNLTIAGSVAIDEIYTAGILLKDFQRTKSRLIEMQAKKYLTFT